jgi:hypothetical protein
MQTAKTIPMTRSYIQPDSSEKYTKWMMPGKTIELTHQVKMAIEYYKKDNKWQIRFNFWYLGRHVKDYNLDNNNQLDLRISCKRMITRLITKHVPGSTRPLKTLIEIENAEYCG